jgi:hypothetical protein
MEAAHSSRILVVGVSNFMMALLNIFRGEKAGLHKNPNSTISFIHTNELYKTSYEIPLMGKWYAI